MRTNSYVEYILGIYASMLSDIECSIPSLRADCIRDYKRLLLAVESAGLPFLMVTLPTACKHLDKCLDAGYLTKFNTDYHRPYKRGGVIPRLFKGLYLRIFHDSGCLRTDFDPQSVRFLRTLLLLCKKYRMECAESSTYKSVEEFYEVDQGCRSPTLNWDDNQLNLSHLHDLTLCDIGSGGFSRDSLLSDYQRTLSPSDRVLTDVTWFIQGCADILSSELGWFNPSEWRFRHGPGAVSDLTPLDSKYEFKSWPDRLENVFPYADFAFANHQLWATSSVGPSENWLADARFSYEGVAKLIAVPKTLDKPRLIASEPVAHQWCQQSILSFLSHSLAKTPLRHCIDFRSQKKNGDLALEASRSASHWTIDLSSASDRMSCWVVERIFRRNHSLLEALHASRTRYIRNDIDKKSPQLYKLKKFSTMGSACTFPVQSIVFSLIAIGSVLFVRKLPLTRENFSKVAREVRVFGDDIIVPEDSGSATRMMLEALGFKLNSSKTFSGSRFRESCGVEAFAGHNVSRTSVLTSPSVSRPESISSTVDCHNNFLSKGFIKTAAYLQQTLQREKGLKLAFGTVGSGAFCLWSFDPWLANSSMRKRFSSDLHRLEYLVTSPIAKGERVQTGGSDMLLQYYTEACKPPDRSEERLGVACRPSNKLVRRWVSTELLYQEAA